MPKMITGANSAALNADILAVFEEEGLDPIREMVKMVTQGVFVEDGEGIPILKTLDPSQRFAVLKELAQYAAPKIKAVDIAASKRSKTIIKVIKHGERALVASGEKIGVFDVPMKNYADSQEVFGALDEAVQEAAISKVVVRSAAQMDVYSKATKEGKVYENGEQ